MSFDREMRQVKNLNGQRISVFIFWFLSIMYNFFWWFYKKNVHICTYTFLRHSQGFLSIFCRGVLIVSKNDLKWFFAYFLLRPEIRSFTSSTFSYSIICICRSFRPCLEWFFVSSRHIQHSRNFVYVCLLINANKKE